MYRKLVKMIFVISLFGSAGCSSHTAKMPPGGVCSLLSDADIQAVQGETISESKPSEQSTGPLITSQCFYRLPTFSRSVNLEVMRSNGSADSQRAIDDFWEKRFGSAGNKDAGADEEHEKEKGSGDNHSDDREEEEHRARLEPVSGLGQEAYWTGSQINGSLYARKNNAILRISIGGPDDQPTKIKKATALAEKVVGRL
jgi:hypothetical protein